MNWMQCVQHILERNVIEGDGDEFDMVLRALILLGDVRSGVVLVTTLSESGTSVP